MHVGVFVEHGRRIALREHQPPRRVGPGGGEHVADAAFLHHPAAVQNGHVAADVLHHAHLVGDDDDGDAHFGVDIADQLQDGVGGLGVQRAGGLVAQQHLGVAGESSRDGHSLLLSAGQLRRVGVRLIRQAYDLQQLRGALFRIRLFHARQLQREANVAQARALHQQVEALEDHGDIPPLGPQLLFGQCADIHAVDQHLPVGGAFQHVDAAHQRAFARAGHADDAVDIAVADGKRHVRQRRHVPRGGMEGFCKMFYFDHSFSFLLQICRVLGKGKGDIEVPGIVLRILDLPFYRS